MAIILTITHMHTIHVIYVDDLEHIGTAVSVEPWTSPWHRCRSSRRCVSTACRWMSTTAAPSYQPMRRRKRHSHATAMPRCVRGDDTFHILVSSCIVIFYQIHHYHGYHGYHGYHNICNRGKLIWLLGLWQLAIRLCRYILEETISNKSVIQSLESRWTIGQLHYECPSTTYISRSCINAKHQEHGRVSMVCDCSFLQQHKRHWTGYMEHHGQSVLIQIWW